jgi:hypothetical protein
LRAGGDGHLPDHRADPVGGKATGSMYLGSSECCFENTERTGVKPIDPEIVLDFSYVLEAQVLPQNGNNVV